MSVDQKVVLLALFNALLITAGTGFQKLNGIRGGNAYFNPLLLVAFLCFAPTFFVANVAYNLGGRTSLFVPVSAVNFVLIALLGRLYFNEPISLQQTFGVALIVGGVGLVATGSPAP